MGPKLKTGLVNATALWLGGYGPYAILHPISKLAVYVSLNPLRVNWLASILQQTPT